MHMIITYTIPAPCSGLHDGAIQHMYSGITQKYLYVIYVNESEMMI